MKQIQSAMGSAMIETLQNCGDALGIAEQTPEGMGTYGVAFSCMTEGKKILSKL